MKIFKKLKRLFNILSEIDKVQYSVDCTKVYIKDLELDIGHSNALAHKLRDDTRFHGSDIKRLRKEFNALVELLDADIQEKLENAKLTV